MRNILNLVLLSLAVTFGAGVAHAQEGPLESLLDVYLVQTATDEDGNPFEQLLASAEAAPGEHLEYVLTYRNRGEQALQGFVIKNRIPENTQYLGDSNQASVEADFTVSIDFGVTFESVPVTRVVTDSTGAERTIVIPPSQYTNLSWRVNESLAPGEEFVLRYRVVIE